MFHIEMHTLAGWDPYEQDDTGACQFYPTLLAAYASLLEDHVEQLHAVARGDMSDTPPLSSYRIVQTLDGNPLDLLDMWELDDMGMARTKGTYA